MLCSIIEKDVALVFGPVHLRLFAFGVLALLCTGGSAARTDLLF